MARLSPEVETALAACGRDRVFHNDGSPPSVAVRWSDVMREQLEPKTADGKAEAWIIGKAEGPAEGHDSAGRRAALEFAARLRDRAKRTIAWAENIELALEGKR